MAWLFELRDAPDPQLAPYEDRAEALRSADSTALALSAVRMADAAQNESVRRGSPLSASSCPCSRTTFDPAALERRGRASSRPRCSGPASGTTRRPPPAPPPPTPAPSAG